MNLKQTIKRILREETNSTKLRLFRRVDAKKLEKMFIDGLGIMTTRYLQNKNNWNAMTSNKFKQAIISYMIVDFCTKFSDVCFGGQDFYDEVWEFLWNYYSDKIEERWDKIK